MNSTYRNLEIICVDDGSKDRSLEILREYELRDSRIVVIAKENGGVSSARNAGLDRMHGDYVTFIDPDDIIHPQLIESFCLAQEKTKADIVICDHQNVHDSDLPLSFPALNCDALRIKETNWVSVFKDYFYGAFCWGRLISSNLVRQKRFPIGMKIGEDGVFFTSLWDRSEPITSCVINEALYYYYVRSDSVTQVANWEERINTIHHFLDPRSAACENGQNVNFVFAVTRLLRYYSRFTSLHIYNKTGAKKVAKLMRGQALPMLRSHWFTCGEKALFLTYAFFPSLKLLTTSLRRRTAGKTARS